MKRRISSQWTWITLIVFPMLFTVAAVVLTVRLYSKGESIVFLIIVFAIFNLAHLAFYGRNKKVLIDDTNLYVSNFLKEIAIPISDIYDVTEDRWMKFHPVTIHLKRPSEFGEKIRFIPTFHMFVFFRGHPIVNELKDAARSMTTTGFLRGPAGSGGIDL